MSVQDSPSAWLSLRRNPRSASVIGFGFVASTNSDITFTTPRVRSQTTLARVSCDLLAKWTLSWMMRRGGWLDMILCLLFHELGFFVYQFCKNLLFNNPYYIYIFRWYGIELDTPMGRHDGTVQGVRYFAAAPNTGVFVTESKLTKIFDNQPTSASCSSSRSGGSSGSRRDLDQIATVSQSAISEDELQQQQQQPQDQKTTVGTMRRKSISMKFRATQQQVRTHKSVCIE